MGAVICSAWCCFLQRMALLFAVNGAVLQCMELFLRSIELFLQSMKLFFAVHGAVFYSV